MNTLTAKLAEFVATGEDMEEDEDMDVPLQELQ